MTSAPASRPQGDGETTGPDVSRYAEYLVTNRDFTAPAVGSAIAAIDLTGMSEPRRILDAGTGAGGALPPLTARAGGHPVLAVDVDERAIALATEHAARNGITDRTEITVADLWEVARDARAEGGVFDLIWASDVVWPASFDDPGEFVAALASAVAPGGTLALYTTNYYQSMFLPGHARLERLIRTASEVTWGLPGDGAAHYERLGAWLRQAGLVDVSVQVFPLASSRIAADPTARAYLEQIVWPEMRHAARSNGHSAGMSEADLARCEELLDPAGAAFVGRDPDAYTVQPTLRWTGRKRK